MGRKKEKTPDGIKRYTIQLDETLYTSIRMSALRLRIKTYELMNRIILIGTECWSKKVKNEINELLNNYKIR